MAMSKVESKRRLENIIIILNIKSIFECQQHIQSATGTQAPFNFEPWNQWDVIMEISLLIYVTRISIFSLKNVAWWVQF